MQRQREINGQTKALEAAIVQKYQKGDIELAQISVFGSWYFVIKQVENVINNKKMVAALEFLNQFIQTVNTRLRSLNYENTIPANMRRFIATIMYCRGRVPIKELDEIAKLLQKRYGKELDSLTVDVDGRVSARLTPCIADPNEVEETLQDILKRNNVPYQSAPVMNPLANVLSASSASSMSGPMPDPMSGPMPNPMPPMSGPMPPMPPMSGPVPPISPMPNPMPPAPTPSAFPNISSDFPPAPTPTSGFPPTPTDFPPAPGFPSAPAPTDFPSAPAFPSAPTDFPAAPGFPSAPADFPAAPAFPSAPADGMGSDPFSIPSSMNIPQPPAIPPLPPTQPPTDDDIQRRFNNL